MYFNAQVKWTVRNANECAARQNRKGIEMYEQIRSARVTEILRQTSETRSERISKLLKLRDDMRAEQRLASEGGTVDDDGLNSDLRDVEMVLEHYGRTPAEAEGKGAATL